jgi:hypothetical protein
VFEGRVSVEQARERLDYAVRRITHPPARQIAAEMLPKAMRDFEEELAGGGA